MTNVNPITTPVLDSPDDQPISPTVYDGPTINDYSNPTRLTFARESIVPYKRNRRTANEGEVTAVHGADEIRTDLVDEPETPGLLLRAYEDLRGRIMRSPKAAVDEMSASVVGDLKKRLAQMDERVDHELATLRAQPVKSEILLRGRRDHSSATSPALVEIESLCTNTEYRRNAARAVPTKTHPMAKPAAPIASNPFTSDSLTKVHTQLPKTPESRQTRVARAHTAPTHHTPIEVPKMVPGLDPKRTLLSPFNELVS